MCRKIRCDEKSLKVFWFLNELNKGLVQASTQLRRLLFIKKIKKTTKEVVVNLLM
jgi:hypothetical protein